MLNNKMPKTFSANSLKILDKSPEEFQLKYEEGLFWTQDSTPAKAGQNLHNFLCYYLKDFDTSKIENALATSDKEFLEKIKTYKIVNTLKNAPKKQIEQLFLVKCTPKLNSLPAKDTQNKNIFYLTGRFDAVMHTQSQSIQIYDWKTQNLPKNPENDIQTIVYLYSASILYKTQDVSITYIALAKDESVTVQYSSESDYLSRIVQITNKCPC